MVTKLHLDGNQHILAVPGELLVGDLEPVLRDRGWGTKEKNDKNIKFIQLTRWSAHCLDVGDVAQLEGLVTRHDGHVGGGVTLGVQVYTAKSEILI